MDESKIIDCISYTISCCYPCIYLSFLYDKHSNKETKGEEIKEIINI